MLVTIFDVAFIRDVVAIAVGTDAFKNIPVVKRPIVVAVDFAGVKEGVPIQVERWVRKDLTVVRNAVAVAVRC